MLREASLERLEGRAIGPGPGSVPIRMPCAAEASLQTTDLDLTSTPLAVMSLLRVRGNSPIVVFGVLLLSLLLLSPIPPGWGGSLSLFPLVSLPDCFGRRAEDRQESRSEVLHAEHREGGVRRAQSCL